MSILTVAVSERDHIRGSADAPVVMVEYADFECPFCGEAYPVVKALERSLENTLAVVFRHFPLASVHPHAQLAAEAAEAAGTQNSFWEMHDMLFENQDALAPSDLLAYAAALGLDEKKFARDLSEHRYAPKVRDDFMSGVRSGVNGTPAFFINGVRHTGSYDFASLLAAIEYVAKGASSRRSPRSRAKGRGAPGPGSAGA
jgi:protein-disulfide isomerase